MLFLGVFAYGMRTGKHRALAAVLFALTVPVPRASSMFFAAIGTVVLFLLWADRKRTPVRRRRVAVVGGLLRAFWYVPFCPAAPYMTDMFYERRPVDNCER